MAGYGEGLDPYTTLNTPTILRTRDIPWDIYMTARLISDRELQFLRRYDKKEPTYQTKLLKEARNGGKLYTNAFLTVLKNVTKDETLQYVLALIDDLLDVDPSHVALFLPPGAEEDQPYVEPYPILLRLLQRPDWFTQEKAARLLTAILASQLRPSAAAQTLDVSAASPAASALTAFVDWLCAQLRRPTHPLLGVPAAAHCLGVLLRDPGVRPLATRAGAAGLLGALVRVPAGGVIQNPQLLYEAMLGTWQLSFHKPAADLLANTATVGGLVDAVRVAQKEKLVRVALLALQNLLAHGPAGLEFAIVDKGLRRVLEVRATQSWDDGDVPELLAALGASLERGVCELSSFERYRRELLLGQLAWGPLHTADDFWAQNAERLAEGNGQLLRVLLKLVESSRDATTLAVGCNDVARFVAAYPHGRGIVTELRGKELVMRLMVHPDQAVQRQALACVQRILLSKDHASALVAGVGA
ncbi:putative V-type proton ATPase subunit H [Auxenochlorella protothecoides]|uniref:V-type proton ATPase subunit H n=1 Tax=Auxenochlorella protothecoides TaxID=3075 RepID=A0A087SI42_AUXPR|nr:putative V-type proton ATPase subunit H [Auxenochlorella protothecoides]KFM25396.1 putative V-type proton ATPase subunit H [Auxenochlorella protothecoides]